MNYKIQLSILLAALGAVLSGCITHKSVVYHDVDRVKVAPSVVITDSPAVLAQRASIIDADLKVRLGATDRILSFSERDTALAAVARDAAKAGNAACAKQAVQKMIAFPERDHAALIAARELLKNGQRAEAVDIAQGMTSFSERDAALKELAK